MLCLVFGSGSGTKSTFRKCIWDWIHRVNPMTIFDSILVTLSCILVIAKKKKKFKVKPGFMLSLKTLFLLADTWGCGLLCVGAVGQVVPVNQWPRGCVGLCGFLMNVRVDMEHLATLKPVWLRPHLSSSRARERTSTRNRCWSKSEVWQTKGTRKTRCFKREMKRGVRREVFVNVCVRMLPLCDRVQCLYVTLCLFSLWYLPSVQNA